MCFIDTFDDIFGIYLSFDEYDKHSEKFYF